MADNGQAGDDNGDDSDNDESDSSDSSDDSDLGIDDPPIEESYLLDGLLGAAAAAVVLGGEALGALAAGLSELGEGAATLEGALDAIGEDSAILEETIGEEATESSADATDHGAIRASERGITDDQIQEAIQTAEQTDNVTTQMGKYGTPQLVYKGSNGVTVIVETAGRNAGKIITLFSN